MKDFWKSRGFKVLACVAAFLIGMMIYAASTGFETISGTILKPLQSAVSAVSDGVHNLFGDSAATLKKENASLKEELNTLRKQQVELEELRRQNETYKEFLALKEENPDFVFVDARVIAADPTDPYGNFTVGAGSLADVEAGNAVITPEGLVGVVSDVGLNYAKVKTVLDPSLQIAAYDSRTREDGLTGNTYTLAKSGELKLTRLLRDTTAAVGDFVVTYGGQYPSGLLIGEITAVKPETDGLSRYAEVKPFAPVFSVAEVFIITDSEEEEATP